MAVQAETMQSDLNNQWEILQFSVTLKNFCQKNKNYLIIAGYKFLRK